MNCSHCGAGNPESARFCQSCGQAVSSPVIDCPTCGHENSASAKFCKDCGGSLKKSEPAVVGAAAVTGGVASTPSSSFSDQNKSRAANSSVSSEATHAAKHSIMEDAVDSMAEEPGTRRGVGFKIGILFLALVILAGFWWALQNGRSKQSHLDILATSQAVSTNASPSKAPTLAEQMGAKPKSVTTTEGEASSTAAKSDKSPGERSAEQSRAREAHEREKKAATDDKRKKAESTRAEPRTQAETAATSTEKPSVERPTTRSLSTTEQVAACNRMSIFARQPCLWKACNNKWGKDGCPSYE